jgi:hypothetical protein
MSTIDLSGLIKGLMVVIGFAVVTGNLFAFKKWAAREAFPKAGLHLQREHLSKNIQKIKIAH